MHMHVDVIKTSGGWQPQLTFESTHQTVYGPLYKQLRHAQVGGLALALQRAQLALNQTITHQTAMEARSSTRTRK